MYHTANIKERIRQMHVSNHASSVNIKELLRDERFWAAVGLVALLVSFILLIIWAAYNGSVIEVMELPLH